MRDIEETASWELDLLILSVPFPHRNLKISAIILPNIRTILAGAI